jgi:hypothetical protein
MPKKGLKGSNNNSMINFYEHKDVKKLATKYHNPHFADTQIDIPARIGVIAPSGTGKTQWLLNYISKSFDTFDHIIVVYKASEPLYEFLRDKVGSKHITFYTKLTDLQETERFRYGEYTGSAGVRRPGYGKEPAENRGIFLEREKGGGWDNYVLFIAKFLWRSHTDMQAI